MKNLEISENFLKNLATLKGSHEYIDNLCQVPGMNYFMILLKYLRNGAEGLDLEVLKQLEKFLIQEFLESNGKIKSIISNFLKMRFAKDEQFIERVRVLFKF